MSRETQIFNATPTSMLECPFSQQEISAHLGAIKEKLDEYFFNNGGSKLDAVWGSFLNAD